MKTRKDFKKTAEIIKAFKERLEKNEDTFDPIQFLLDEFSYWYEEENPRFNETKFKQYALDI